MESQICCSNKLLQAMDVKPVDIPPERRLVPPLSSWYADLFNFNRRKCLVFYNPATGYGMVAAYVTKKRIANLSQELLRTFQDAVQDDGVSPEKSKELLSAIANPTICRTSDRKTRAYVVHAIRDAEFLMWRAVMSDPAALERTAHVGIAHGVGGPTQNPLKAFGEIIGEKLTRRILYGDGDRDISQVLVTIKEIEPPIWRRIMIPSAFRLNRAHLVIQGAFGWTNSHLHIFRAGGKAFEAIYDKSDEYEGADERQFGFYDLLALGGGSAEYVYDYGDYWQHTIQLEERFLSEHRHGSNCFAGARACPPEDVGGVSGYERMLSILTEPTDEEYKTFIEWLPEGYDPEAFSSDAANERIQAMLTYQDTRF